MIIMMIMIMLNEDDEYNEDAVCGRGGGDDTFSITIVFRTFEKKKMG